MTRRRVPLPALAALVLPGLGGCLSPQPATRTAGEPAEAPLLAPSPHRIVGVIVAVDADLAFAFVEPSAGAPADALAPGASLLTRSAALVETGRLQATRHRRSRTLGTRILAGRPAVGDEVVWLAAGDRFPALQAEGAAYVSPP